MNMFTCTARRFFNGNSYTFYRQSLISLHIAKVIVRIAKFGLTMAFLKLSISLRFFAHPGEMFEDAGMHFELPLHCHDGRLNSVGEKNSLVIIFILPKNGQIFAINT